MEQVLCYPLGLGQKSESLVLLVGLLSSGECTTARVLPGGRVTSVQKTTLPLDNTAGLAEASKSNQSTNSMQHKSSASRLFTSIEYRQHFTLYSHPPWAKEKNTNPTFPSMFTPTIL